MITSNNNIFGIKCYINLFNIVADEMQGCSGVAMLLDGFYSVLLKKI